MKWKAYPAYKDSGIEWLGDVPAHWKWKRLKYCGSLINEKGNGIRVELPYTGLEHIESWTGRILSSEEPAMSEGQANYFKSGDVLFGKLRPYLAKVLRATVDGICSGELLVLRPKNTTQDYLFYYLLGRDFIRTVDSSTYGAKMPRANWELIGNLPVLLPLLDEQHSISTFLDRETERIDTLIAKKERQIELLQEKRSALISHAVTKGLNPNVKMKDSGIEWLGQIPKHWRVVPLRGVLAQRDEFNDGPRTTNILSVVKDVGVINYDDREASGNKKSDNIEQYKIIHKGDIVLNRMNVIIGSVGIAHEFGAASIEYYVLHEKNNSVSTDYYGHIFCSRAFQTNLGRLGSGILGHRLRIPYELLRLERLPEPPHSEQREIADFLSNHRDAASQRIQKVQTSINLLREYRTAVISAAVTGKIDVLKEVSP